MQDTPQDHPDRTPDGEERHHTTHGDAQYDTQDATQDATRNTPENPGGGPPSHPSSSDGTNPRATNRTNTPQARFTPGQLVADRYRIVAFLGRGGMGEVYRADDLELAQSVAIKFLPARIAADPALAERVRAEVRLARGITHRNVCRIHDIARLQPTEGNGQGGDLFITMEYVDGEDLATLLRRIGKLPQDKAIDVARQLCAALAAAHDQGVIHRDLKPSNILVNDDGQPKILDFGVARSNEADLQMTEVGTTRGQIVGTLAYMSPEQLAGDPGDIDTRADVYALGVIAYELFADRRPHDLANKSLPEAIRTVQTDDPPTLETLVRESRGDLSTIVFKAMEKDRDRRYQSASLFAADLTRFLRSEPILARPPTTMYRVRKFTSRNPVLVAGLAAVFVVLIVGIIATSSTAAWALDAEAKARANAEEAAENAAIAQQERAIADAVNEFLNNDLLAAADPQNNRDRDITMREVVDIASENIEGRFPDQPLVEARIRLTLSETYQNLGVLDEAERHARIGVALFIEHKGPGDLETVSYAITLATTLMHRGAYAEAAEIVEPLLLERKIEAGPLDEIYLLAATNLGSAYMRLGRMTDAEPLLVEAYEGKKQTLGPTHERTLTSVNQLANLYAALGRDEDALACFNAAFEGRRETLGAEHPRTITAMVGYATLLTRLERTDEARGFLAEGRAIAADVLGPRHPRTVSIINAQAMNETQAENFDAAIAFARDAAAGMRAALGPDHPETISFDFNLARALARAGRHDEALPIFETVEAREAESLPETHWYRGMTFHTVAESLRSLGRLEEAERRAERAMCIFDANFDDADRRWRDAFETLSSILAERGNDERSRSLSEARESGTIGALLCDR